jgi:F-type H+-transporting ATPase subunit delta
MTSRTAANRYARALFDVALHEKIELAAIEQQLSSFDALMTEHPTLKQVLLNPAVPTPRKRSAVVALTARASLLPVVAKLLVLLADRDRLSLLPDLLAGYRERMRAHQNVVSAEVTTAVPLAADRVDAINHGLARATGRSVNLSTRVDPSLLGGVVAKIGSIVYDASVTGQLRRLRQQLSESV